MRFLLGSIILLVGIILWQFINADWMPSYGIANFIDIPSMLSILLVLVGVIVITNGGKDFLAGMRIAFGKTSNSKEELESAITLFELLQKVIIYTGLIAFLVALIQIANNYIDTYYMDILTSNFAIALLPVYYSLIGLVFLSSIVSVLKKRAKK